MPGPNFNKALKDIRGLESGDFSEKIGGIINNNSLLAGVVVVDSSADAPFKKREFGKSEHLMTGKEKEALDDFIAEANEIIKQKKAHGFKDSKTSDASSVLSITDASPANDQTETYLSAYAKNKDVFKDAVHPWTVIPDDMDDTKKLTVKDLYNDEVKFEIYPDRLSSNRCDPATCDAMLGCFAEAYPDGTPGITAANDEAKQAMEEAISRYKEKNPDSRLYDNVTVNVGKIDSDAKAAPAMEEQSETPTLKHK